MLLWLILALMTAAAIFAVLWPPGRAAEARAGNDLAVYRDQLDEIERDRRSGLIGKDEAEAARVEGSRRLIVAADSAERAHSLPAGARLRGRRCAARGPPADGYGRHCVASAGRRRILSCGGLAAIARTTAGNAIARSRQIDREPDLTGGSASRAQS